MIHTQERYQEVEARLAELAAAAPPEEASRILEVVAGLGVGAAVMVGSTGLAAAHEAPASGMALVEQGSNLTETFAEHGLTLEQGLAIPANARYRANPDRVFPNDQVDVTPEPGDQASPQQTVQVGVIGKGHTTWGFANHVGADENQVMKAVQFDLDKVKPGQQVIFKREGQWHARTIVEGDTIGAIALAEKASASSFRMLTDFDRSKVWEGDMLAVVTQEAQPQATTVTQGIVALPEGGSAWSLAEKITPLTPEAETVSDLANRIVAANNQDPTLYQVNQLLRVPGVSQEIIDQAMNPTTEAAPVIEAASVSHGSVQEVFTPDTVAQILPNAPRENVEAYTPLVLSALAEQGIDNPQVISYAFATINAETSAFAPIREYASGMAYEPHTRIGRQLGNTEPGDGPRYRGRGFVQLTGRNNYRHMGEVLGIDLENNPDLALEPETAARILAVFLAERQDRLVPALERDDMVAARRVVNGGTHGINRMASAYETATAIAESVVVPPTTPEATPEVAENAPEPVTELPPVVEVSELVSIPEPEAQPVQENEQETPASEPDEHDHEHGNEQDNGENTEHHEDDDEQAPEPDPAVPVTEGQGSAPVTEAPAAEVVAPTPAPVESAQPQHSVAGETFIHPVGEQYRVTSDFGPREAPRTRHGRGSSMHNGTDYGTPVGTPVVAPQDGEIVFAGEKGPNGNLVVVSHGPNSNGQDVTTAVAHLDSVAVREGDHVVQGQEIARSGNTGNSGGAHAHITVRVGGEPVNPEPVLSGDQEL